MSVMQLWYFELQATDALKNVIKNTNLCHFLNQTLTFLLQNP